MRLDIYGFKGIVLVGTVFYRDKGAVFVEVYGFSRYGFSRYCFRGCLEKLGAVPHQNFSWVFFFDLLNASLLSFQ